MRRTVPRMVLGVLTLAAAFVARDARAQAPGTGSTPLTNPYTNPYLNPYMNPAMTTGTTNRSDSLLYLWSAQQMPGGLLGGPPSSATARKTAATRIATVRSTGVRTGVAEMPRATMLPGGGSARYFNPGSLGGPGAAVVATRFQQHHRYFSNNGR